MSNEFPKFSEVFTLDKSVTYNEAITQVWYPQDNAILSVPSVSPIETVMLENNKIVPTVALLQISYNVVSDKILNFIDYSNLRDGAIIQLRIQDDTFPITIKNGIVGDGSIMTADGNDIILNDYRKIVQFQREGTLWRQVGGIQIQADNKTIARTEDNTFEVFGIKDQGVDATAKKIWTGTREAFELLEEKADNVFYFVQDQGIYLGEKELSGAGLEIGDIGFAPLGVDETQNKRRYLNGQVISQAQFVSFTNKIKAAIQLTPSLATSETNWQAEVTNSPYGICGKFVIDDTLGTIRLPKYPDWSIREVGQAPVVGNGMTLGLSDGTTEYGTMFAYQYGNYQGLSPDSSNVGSPVSTSGGYDTHIPTPTSIMGVTTDPTKSGIITDLVNANTEDKLQGKWFIQVATGTEESVDVTREIELNNPFSLLDYKWSEYELNNASWLLSNGAFHSGATYVAVYELLLKIQNGTETKDGVSVKLSTEAYADTDFVINTADTTFRLPIKVKLASGNAVVGNGYGLGLICGSEYDNKHQIRYLSETSSNYPAAGDIVTSPIKQGEAYSPSGSGFSDGYVIGISGVPELSGIETSSNGLKLYFYVGETIQDANVIAASQVLTKVANCIDRTVASDRETVVRWGMPDYSAEIDIKSSVVSANGYTCVSCGQCFFKGNSDSDLTIIINGKTVMVNSTTRGYAAGFAFNVDKGDVIKGSNVYSAQFFPLKGVN